MASGATLITFFPCDNEPPASAYATLDTRNAHPTLMNADIREMVFPNVWSFFSSWEDLKFDFYWEKNNDEG